MIVTQSVSELFNQLCTSLRSDSQSYPDHEPLNNKQLKICKSRAFEILLKRKLSTTVGQHELYLHQFELAFNGQNSQKYLEMNECCRLVEGDEYFNSDIGQSILTFLLKLRNSVKSFNRNNARDESPLTNYFFKSTESDRDPYFFLPPDMLKLNRHDLAADYNPFTGKLLHKNLNVNENNFFGLQIHDPMNLFLPAINSSNDGVLRNSNPSDIQLRNRPTSRKNDTIIVRCARWDNLGQPMDYLNAKFTSEVDVTNELFGVAAFQNFEAKVISLSQLMGDVKLLLVGIQSDSFHFDQEHQIFRMEPNLTIENISPETIANSVVTFLQCGSCYRRLQMILSRNPIDFKYKFDGFVFKALCTSVSSLLIVFSQFVHVFDDTFLAQLSLRMSFMIKQIEILADILQVHPKLDISMERALATLPRGSKFLNYLYRKFTAVTQVDMSMLLFRILKECSTVYFKNFETWIFRGFIEDSCKELFIEFTDFYQPNTKHFWDKAYTVQRQSVPGFLLGCEEATLLCGKYTMLLQTIKPTHPFLALPTPSIQVCYSHQQISQLENICKKYVQDAQDVCGPPITVRQVYQQKSIKKIEFRQRCAVRFQENLEQWHEEQIVKNLENKSNKEKNRKILEEQIREVRERKIQKRQESLARDREYLRHAELLENERLASENMQRQKTLEYYEELGRIVNEQRQRADEKIQILSNKLKSEGNVEEKFESTSIMATTPIQSFDDKAEHIMVAIPIQPLDDKHESIMTTTPSPSADDEPELKIVKDETTLVPNSLTTDDICVEPNMRKSASDYFNSNEIPSEFTTNKLRVLGSTIEFSDAISTARPTTATEELFDAQKNKLKAMSHSLFTDNQTNPLHRDANSNELHAPTLTDRQRNKAKVLASEFDICPIVAKTKAAESISNTEFQNNQQRAGAHTDIFGNEKIDEFKRNRSKVLTEEFGYTSVDGIKPDGCQVGITPVDWKPIRTSLSLDFAKNIQTHPDAPTPMSISSDTPTIHEEETNESNLKIKLPPTTNSAQHNFDTMQTADTIYPTPNSALNTAGILNKYGFIFETTSAPIPPHRNCYDLNFSLANVDKTSSFFSLPMATANDEATDDSTHQNDLKDVSITTITNFLKMSFIIPIHARLSILNNEILKIFLQDLDILGHLKSLRNFFLMMDGEFSSCISDGLITRLECTKTPAELFNFQFLHTILHNALNATILGNDQNADRLSFIITDVPDKFDWASPNVLRTLNLSYRIEWPLNLVLTPEAMNLYANIFQHLLKVRRINWVLEQSYQILKEEAKTSKQKISTSPQYRHVQQIRSKLLVFVNALQNHITSNALQASWRAFKIELEATHSIEDLYHKHAKYLKRVKFLCMLNRSSAEFFTKLEDVFIVVLRFYYQLKQRSWRSNNTHPNFDKFLIIEKDFQKLIKFIIRIGSKISRCGYQTEIGDFINIINFNGFYDEVPVERETN